MTKRHSTPTLAERTEFVRARMAESADKINRYVTGGTCFTFRTFLGWRQLSRLSADWVAQDTEGRAWMVDLGDVAEWEQRIQRAEGQWR